MTKTPRDVTPSALVRALSKAGFFLDRQTGSHARLKHPDGRATSVAVTHDPNFEAIAERIVDFWEINRKPVEQVFVGEADYNTTNK